MSGSSFEAVLWDMDGTLVDSEPAHLASIVEVLVAAGCPVPGDLHAWLIGRSITAAYEILRDRLGLPISHDEFVAQKTHAYLALAPGLKPRPGAAEVFRDLARAGVRQAVVSNSDRLIVDANLRAVGLATPGLVTVSRNDVRHGKPEPEPFLRAAWLLGAEPARCAVVEDSPPGARGGLAAGMAVLAWPEPGTSPEFPAGARLIGSADDLRHALTTPAPERIAHVP